MNELYEQIQTIKNSGSRGQELMIDSFVIGYLFAQKKLKTSEDLQEFLKQLKELKNEIDQDLKLPSARDEYLLNKLSNLPILQMKEKQEDLQQQQKIKKKEQKQQGIKNKDPLSQTTPIIQNVNKDQIDFQQSVQVQGEDEGGKKQNSKKTSKGKKATEGVQTRNQALQSKTDQQQNE
ncbi:unnamed protein product [Paramecium sonneborni]|uniref:Uncharacterized protein n=1 Tax=Paramecium sonneborni TaxID=65129 RepID=A0A8S1K9S2_9CILI|nr:unnamed protein product [Paramecium sonneborni]